MSTTDCTTTALSFARIAVASLMDALCEAKDAAVEKAAGNQRWLNAIDAAWGWLLTQDAVFFDTAAHALRVPSATEAGRAYVANGDCQCKAFDARTPCLHRAAARLVRRALELQAAQAEADERAELNTLASELVSEAHAAGARWYGAVEGLAGARLRLGELTDFAIDWDAMSAAARPASIAHAA
jgi:hypothetical protein